jgi:plasmid stability protein
MAELAIHDVPDHLYTRIAERAKDRGRSVESLTLDILNAWLADEEREARIVAEAKANREELAQAGIFMTDEELDAAINWGRE